MTFEEKLTNQEYDRIWQEYCGFLDLDMDSYEDTEKAAGGADGLWCANPIGKSSEGQEAGELRVPYHGAVDYL